MGWCSVGRFPWIKLALQSWLQQRYIHSSSQIQIQMPIFSATLNMLGLRKTPYRCAQLSSGKAKTPSKTPNQRNERAVLEAQKSLIDYLHHTRDVPFPDAEYMVTNAPSFVGKLLSTSGKQTKKAIDKFLHYNPINEFEPFLESIGIGPSDIDALLPADQIYLAQNKVMMDNVSALRRFGIPRNKLGKLYKQAREIFDYQPGVLKEKLQAYEDLGVGKAFLAKIYACYPLLLKDNYINEFRSLQDDLNHKILTDSCLDISSKSWMDIVEVFELFDRLGCAGKEVITYVRKNLEVLLKCSMESLNSKVSFLSKMGLRTEDIGSIIIQDPGILKWDIEGSMAKNIELLESIGLKQEELQEIVRSCPYVLGSGSLKKLIEMMVTFGLNEQEITKLIKDYPKITASCTKLSKINADQIQNMPGNQADQFKTIELFVTGQGI